MRKIAMAEQSGSKIPADLPYDAGQSERAPTKLTVGNLAHMARDAHWSLDTPRSYLVPSLIWFTGGQGRMMIGEEMRGFTGHNALFIPANTSHAFEFGHCVQGAAVFFAAAGNDLPYPDHLLHLRLYGVALQSELNRMIDDLAHEAQTGGQDSDTVLYHQSALLLYWLRRQDFRTAPVPGAPRGSDTAKASGEDHKKP
ncbi:MAG: hypothetical protein OIF40_16695 [Mangrovicoccus sp.]|nr:hypothetical protein [Mangrovicoccus sp.]